ncbi:family 16 glycosylhydrolase [Streptosporangium sp. NPDC048047]|uniref:family 16 glycosylhydrolase n=1 Tax=Streptosporangium sp. NPDC048047 TaxID=3155748 RepID=UPI00344AFF93
MSTRKLLTVSVSSLVVAGALWTGTGTARTASSSTLTVASTADTTITQVTQDGDNGVKTTLATCPATCEGNSRGQRDAVVAFDVSGLPAGARNIRASLQLYSWNAYTATTTAHTTTGDATGDGSWADRGTPGAALDTRTAVTAGYNAWDVSEAVRGNGKLVFTVMQTARTTRTYWASRENSSASLRPRLVITYDPSSTASPSPTGSPTPKPTASPTSSPTPTASSTGGPAGWTKVWADEFDGASLDTSTWEARNNTRVDFDRACITNRPENVRVSGGSLFLTARKETRTCGSETRAYTTAYLTTMKRLSFTYGRFEVRAKSPNGPTGSTGLWPAFWLRPEDGANGEIDVMELPGGSAYYAAATQAIFNSYSPQVKQDQRFPFTTGYPGDGFHTYTTEWEPGVMRWYIDGRKVWQRDRTTTSWFDSAFSKPYHLRFTFHVGGWLGDPDAATRFPADFQVDYVRVWKRS